MTSYSAPLRDMQFVLEEVIGLDQVATLPGYEAVSDDLVRAVLAVDASEIGAVAAIFELGLPMRAMLCCS